MKQIVAGADLDYLGRSDIFVIGEKLFEELLVLMMNKEVTVYRGERVFMKESFEQSQDADIISPS